MAIEDLIKKIKGMTLTRADGEIAEYFLDHLDTLGLMTSTALADEIGVSDTSIIRFIRKLGFRGYMDFRNEMNNRIVKYYAQKQDDLSPGKKYALSKELLNQESLISDVCRYTMENLQKSFSKLDRKTIDEVVDIILGSNRKFVAGFRGTACCAQYMSSKLLFVTANVIPLVHADATAAERLVDITEKDCLILYSFPRYSEINFLLLDIARENGAKIILITDRVTSPLASKSDVVVAAQVTGLGFTNSYVVPLSLSEVFVLAICGRLGGTFQERFDRIDEVVERKKLY